MQYVPVSRRDFVRTASAAGLLGALPVLTAGCTGADNPARDTLAKILIVGGGAAGLAMAARLRRMLPRATLTVVEPAERHVCQPALTLVATGHYRTDLITRKESTLIPSGVQWLRDAMTEIDADHNTASLAKGGRVRYDFLVLAPGVQQNWTAIQGITPSTPGRGNVHSVYDREGADRTWRALKKLASTGGRALFTDASTPSACTGAAKSICLLTEALSRRLNARSRVQADFLTSARRLCDVPHNAPRLKQIFDARGIQTWTGVRLVGVDVRSRKATFENIRTKETFEEEYGVLHFAPPQSAPDFVRASGLGWTEGEFADGAWIKVDPSTLVHLDRPNIVALGDAAALPTDKTASAVRRQAPVAAANLCSLIAGRAPSATYDGYAANPVVTDFGHVMRLEADYGRRPAPTLPYALMDTSRELRCAWWEFRHLTQPLYFNLLLRGLA